MFLLFLNNDIHSATALKLLLPTLKSHKTKIILSQKVGKIDGLPEEILEMKNYEKCEFDWREKFGLEVLTYDDVSSGKALRDFKNFSPDLIISIRFGQIFKQDLINLPRFGVLNLHSGLLPQYRGIMATFWAILNGEEKIGTSLHYITDPGIDTGDVIAFSSEEIDWNSSLILNINKLYRAGCANILRSVEKIFSGQKLSTESQFLLGSGKYFSYPKSGDIENFLRRMPLFKTEDVQKISNSL